MANNDYDKLIKSASEKLGSSPEALRCSIEKKDLSSLSSMLTKSDKEKLRKVLARPPAPRKRSCGCLAA